MKNIFIYMLITVVYLFASCMPYWKPSTNIDSIMKKYLLLGFVFVQISFVIQAQHLSPDRIKPMNNDTLKKYMYQTMNDFGIPGLAVSIFTGEKILNAEILGVRKIHTNDSLKITDKFHLGSCGKPMTCFVAGRLVEKGLITWDTEFFDLFPELKDSSNIAYNNITFKDLLSHRSRVRPFTDSEEFEVLPNLPVNNETQRRYAFTKWLLKQTPVEFGTSKELRILDSIMNFTYSNAGYSVAALMMEKITGKEWKDIINDELFKPLGIQATFGWPAFTDKSQPWGHWIKDGDSLLTPHSPNDSYQIDNIITPAGDYSMSILDHTRYLQINLIGLSGKDKLLKSSTYHFIHYCNLDKNDLALVRYSIGWFANETTSSHNGSDGTFLSRTRLFTKKGYGIIIETNSCDERSQKGLKKLIEVLDEYFE